MEIYWTYKGTIIKDHSDLLDDCTNFVYIIKYTNGQKYIGKKCVKSVRKKPPLKGKKRCRRILTNLPFVEYTGSSDLTNELVVLSKEILYQCSNKRAATYLETSLLFKHDVLFDDTYVNANISGKMFGNSLDGLLEHTHNIV